MKIGIIGCGSISGIYLENCVKRFSNLEVVACSDLIEKRAQEAAARYEGVKALSVDQLLASEAIELVVNLTQPAYHSQLNERILSSGKHVYVEKPLGLNLREADRVLELAARKGLQVGCAPDTVLGAGIQRCRAAVDDDHLGLIHSGSASFACHGHESWHSGADFYYKKGGGPLFDMGPYYLTSLVTLLGPAAEVYAVSRRESDQRVFTEPSRKGDRIEVQVDTHYSLLITFVSGAVISFTASFDIHGSENSLLELHGSKGSLICPDPNGFGGSPRYRGMGDSDWENLDTESFSYSENSRGIGVSDMAEAIDQGRPARCSGQLARHVLEIMCAADSSALLHRPVVIEYRTDMPQAMARR